MNENFSPKRRSISPVKTYGIRKIQHMKRKPTMQSSEQGREVASSQLDFHTASSCFNNSKINDDIEAERKQPQKMYEFACSGINGKDGSCLNGRTVEWKASFELPLEEFVYPSLQRCKYDDASSPQVAPSKNTLDQKYAADVDNKIRQETRTPVIPHWSVTVGDASATDPEGKPINLKEKDLLVEIDRKGEEFLRKRLNQITGINTHLINGVKAKRNSLTTIKPVLTNSEKITKDTYMEIRRACSSMIFDDVILRRSSDVSDSPSSPSTPSELNSENLEKINFTAEVSDLRALVRERSILSEFIPLGMEDTQEGLLYYRLRNEKKSADQRNKSVSFDTSVAGLIAEKGSVSRELRSSLFQNLNAVQHQMIDKNVRTSSAVSAGSTYPGIEGSTLKALETGPGTRIRPAQGMHSYNYKFISAIKERKLLMPNDSTKSNMNSSTKTQSTIDTRPSSSNGLPTPVNSSADPGPDLQEQLKTAEDALLLAQLDAGRIPSEFLQKASYSSHLQVTVDLSNFGIGDTHGLCLAQGLLGLPTLCTLGLSDNRLSSMSICPIIKNISSAPIMRLDLSKNSLTGNGAASLTMFLKERNCLSYLDISECRLTPKEVGALFKCLLLYRLPSPLQDLNISLNRIDLLAVQNISAYLAASRICRLRTLDLSNSNIGTNGAALLAVAMIANKTLTHLKLSSCAIGDSGAQSLASSLQTQQGSVGRGANVTLRILDLSRNNIKSSACFVFANVLSMHASMRELNLSGNPLGEAGTRSLLRKVLLGDQFKCNVLLHDCTYAIEKNVLDYTYPELDSPYILDLCQQYSIAVLSELTTLADEDLGLFQFESLMYKDSPKGIYSPLNAAQGGGIVVKSGGSLKLEIGRVPFSPAEDLLVIHQQKMETIEQRMLPAEGLQAMKNVLQKALTDADRRSWLKLICCDIQLTTAQGQDLINFLKVSKLVGTAGATAAADVVEFLWIGLLDEKNKFNFLYRNSSSRERRDIANSLTFEVFKFSRSNPTGRWRLDLSNRTHRALFLRIVDLNTEEAYYSRDHSGRDDTSQKGNWFNFRNERLNTLSPGTFVIDDTFLSNIPTSGFLEFDYIGTNRPPPADLYYPPEDDNDSLYDNPSGSEGGLTDRKREKKWDSGRRRSSGSVCSIIDKERDRERDRDRDRDGDLKGSLDRDRDRDGGREKDREREGSLRNRSSEHSVRARSSDSHMHTVSASKDVDPGPDHPELSYYEDNDEDNTEISDAQFDTLMSQLGLVSRRSLDSTSITYLLLEMQLAAADFYFPVKKVLQIVTCYFAQDSSLVKARVVVCLISRISDLHNFVYILRSLKSDAQQEIISRVGWLNIFNPLRPAFNYDLSLRHWDNCIMVSMLTRMADKEKSPGCMQIKEDVRSQVALSSIANGSVDLHSTSHVSDGAAVFSYGEVAERTLAVCWETRKEMLRKCLIGSGIYDDDDDEEEYRKKSKLDGSNIYDIITWFNLLEEAGSFSSGPLDLQFGIYSKSVVGAVSTSN